MGNMCRSLELLANDPDSKKRGQTYQGLISGLKSFLHLYRTTIVQVGHLPLAGGKKTVDKNNFVESFLEVG
jgi:hypothetical protein